MKVRILSSVIIGLFVLVGGAAANDDFVILSADQFGKNGAKQYADNSHSIKLKESGSNDSLKGQRIKSPKNEEAPLLEGKSPSHRKKITTLELTKKTGKKTGVNCSVVEEGCFTDCLKRWVDPNVVVTCAEACANSEYSSCAVCIGVGVAVVLGCAYECVPLAQ